MDRQGILAIGESLEGTGGLARIGATQKRVLENLGWEIQVISPDNIASPRTSRRYPALNNALLSWQIGRLARQASRNSRLLFSHGMCGASGSHSRQVHLYHGTCAGLSDACRARLSRLERLILRRVNGYLETCGGRLSTPLAVSTSVVKEVRHYYRIARAEVMYNTVDTNHFIPTPLPPPRSNCTGLCVGRMDYGKGRETVRRIGELLPDDYRLQLAAPQIMGEISWPNGRLTSLGTVGYADLPAAYSGADYLLCASRYEGFGLTLLEAWACGRPVVTTNVGIIQELRALEPTLDCMVVDDPDDAQGFAERIRMLHDDPTIGICQAAWGRQIAVERFSLHQMQAGYRALLGT
jgi:glycosyltransferase involved in cell wall biosynthesis